MDERLDDISAAQPQPPLLPEAVAERVDTEAPTVEQASCPEPTGAGLEWARAVRSYVPTVKIAEGGFSEIWEAIQVELGRVVAIKRLKERTDAHGQPLPVSPRHVAMFRQEALVAAHLEHPNILPVYDLEYGSDGLPFLVMKRVRGEPWSATLKRDFEALPRRAYLAKHLPILLALARAVAYAHAAGIVHRDLKPQQVMIGSFGEVLLMDWGLAMAYPRRVGDPDAPAWLADPNALVNRPINPAGTPSYMAPEQTESTTHRLGPWTDVYLLGAILYRILTGRAPHEASDGNETFKLAQLGRVEPFREHLEGGEIPEPLAELVLDCLEPEIDKRLPSAAVFLERLEEYLAGAQKAREAQSIVAQVRERLERSDAGYETLAAAINQLERALVLWPEDREAEQLRQVAIERYARLAVKNHDLKLARLQAERLADSPVRRSLLGKIEELERRDQEREAQLAEAHRRVREERDRAERLVEYLVGDLYRQLERLGHLDVLASMCERAGDYFDSLSSQTQEEPDVALTRSRAYLNIAAVHSARGQQARATAMAQRALATIAQQLERHPEDATWLSLQTRAMRLLGLLAYYRGEYAQAKHWLEAAHESAKRALDVEGSLDNEARLAEVLHAMGQVAWRTGQLESALTLHVEAETLLARLSRRVPGDSDYAGQRAEVLATLGNVYRDLGELERAIEVTHEALRLLERLHALDAGNVARAVRQMWVRNNLGLLLLIRGDRLRARDLFLENVTLGRDLVRNHPTSFEHLRDLGFALSLAGEVSYMLHDIEQASSLLNEALVVSKEMLGRSPDSLYVRCGVARLHAQVGELALVRGERERGLTLLRQAAALAEDILAAVPSNPTATKAWLRSRLLLWLEEPGSRSSSAELLERARKLLDNLSSPSDHLDRLDNEAALALAQGDFSRALAILQELHERAWLAPYLVQAARRQGLCPPTAGATHWSI